MSLPLDEIIAVLRDRVKDQTLLKSIASDLIAAEKELKESAAADKQPKARSRFVVAIRGSKAQLEPLVSGGAWVLTVSEDDPATASTLFDRIVKAARYFNDTLRGKRKSKAVKTFRETMEHLKPKAIKVACAEAPFTIKSKLPVEVVVVEQDTIQ